MKNLLRKLRERQEGITGLETAIILIAFVIVASVFAYVVLSAGLFSSQKAKEAITAGLQSTMSTIEIRGNIVATMVGGVVTEIAFPVGIPAAGSAVDFSQSSTNETPVVISYMDADNYIPSCNWTLTKLATINNDNMLDHNELFQITVELPGPPVNVGPYSTFSLEIKPPDGPVLDVERTVPGRVSLADLTTGGGATAPLPAFYSPEDFADAPAAIQDNGQAFLEVLNVLEGDIGQRGQTPPRDPEAPPEELLRGSGHDLTGFGNSYGSIHNTKPTILATHA